MKAIIDTIKEIDETKTPVFVSESWSNNFLELTVTCHPSISNDLLAKIILANIPPYQPTLGDISVTVPPFSVMEKGARVKFNRYYITK